MKNKLLALWSKYKNNYQTYVGLAVVAIIGYYLMLKVQAFNDIPGNVADLACVLISLFVVRKWADKTLDKYFKTDYPEDFKVASPDTRIKAALGMKAIYVLAAVLIFM